MSLEELSARWDGYLGKLKDRYFEIMNSAEAPLADVINNLQYDNVIIHNVKTGLNNQTVIQLGQKAEEGWGKMETQMLQFGKFFWNQKSSEHQKMTDFKEWIDVEFLKFETDLYARAARKILENVKQHINEKKMHLCTQCGAELPINVYSFMAVNIKCDSCGSVNTYQPDDRVRALEYYVINSLADEKALPFKIKARYDKSAQKEYYAVYYNYLMENVPDKKEFYQRQMEERLKNPFFG